MENKQRRFSGIIIRSMIGIGLVVFLICNVSTEKLVQSLTQVSLSLLIVSLSYQYASIFLGACNQYILLSPFLDLSWKTFISAYFKAYALGLLLPGRFGDAAIGFFLKPEGLHYSQTFSAYVLDKYLTFILYLAILILFVGNLMGYSTIILLLLWALFALVMPLFLYSMLHFTSLLPLGLQKSRLTIFIINLTSQIHDFGKHHPFLLVINFFLTCIKLGLVILCYHAMIASLGYSLNKWDVGLAALASGIVAYIPVSIQGLGTVETAAIFNFKTLGVSSTDVLVCYLLLRMSNYAFSFVAYVVSLLLKIKTG